MIKLIKPIKIHGNIYMRNETVGGGKNIFIQHYKENLGTETHQSVTVFSVENTKA